MLLLLFIALIGFVIYLDRRLAKLEMWVALYDESLTHTAVEPADPSWLAHPAEEIAQTVEEVHEPPAPSTVLYAEPRPESPTSAASGTTPTCRT